MRSIVLTRYLGLVLLATSIGAGSAAGQEASPGSTETATVDPGADTDPTKPVLFSIRDEFVRLPGNRTANVLIGRGDVLAFKKKNLPGAAKGLLLRADVPFVSFDDGSNRTRGLGDLYGQAVLIPRLSPKFTVAYGSGLVMPTATDDVLGHGKWIVAPAVAPVWLFPRRGLAFIKLQDWVSVAGEGDRPDVHYLTITPTWQWRIGKLWWTLLDAESTTNWEQDNRTSFRGGFLLGRMLSTRLGLSLKVEFPFGGFQQTDKPTLKLVLFRTKF